MTPLKRGKQLRQAINYSIRNNCVFYEIISENRYEAYVSLSVKIENIENAEEFGWSESVVAFEINFTPDQFDYSGHHVYNCGALWPVDWKSYRWAVRTLSQHLTMKKLCDNLEIE